MDFFPNQPFLIYRSYGELDIPTALLVPPGENAATVFADIARTTRRMTVDAQCRFGRPSKLGSRNRVPVYNKAACLLPALGALAVVGLF